MMSKGAADAILPKELPLVPAKAQPALLLLTGGSILLAGVCLIVLRHVLLHAATWPQGWINPFDAGIVTYVNRFADRWPLLNVIFRDMEEHNLLKGGPVVLLFWVAFFQRDRGAVEALERRRKLAATIPLAIFGIVLARLLALLLPFRERPLRTVDLHFKLPHALRPAVLYGWSSFPSDHAVLFVTLGVGLLLASRRLGILALAYTFVAIMIPRIYLGLHWPTDLLAGAAIGVALASIVAIPAYRDFVWRIVTKCWQRSPGISAAFVFLLSYEIIDLFSTPLAIAKAVLHHHPK
ncbi:MAG TPA: phosphatase PAP2 family protein [Acidobacteriaceae bacterium]|nr:phosphatase PAP2 family protein [Acidobacteriaceae bacterium]